MRRTFKKGEDRRRTGGGVKTSIFTAKKGKGWVCWEKGELHTKKKGLFAAPPLMGLKKDAGQGKIYNYEGKSTHNTNGQDQKGGFSQGGKRFKSSWKEHAVSHPSKGV